MWCGGHLGLQRIYQGFGATQQAHGRRRLGVAGHAHGSALGRLLDHHVAFVKLGKGGQAQVLDQRVQVGLKVWPVPARAQVKAV